VNYISKNTSVWLEKLEATKHSINNTYNIKNGFFPNKFVFSFTPKRHMADKRNVNGTLLSVYRKAQEKTMKYPSNMKKMLINTTDPLQTYKSEILFGSTPRTSFHKLRVNKTCSTLDLFASLKDGGTLIAKV
jgi:hypothetical protein